MTSSGPLASDFQLADVNRDGRLDVVGSNFGSSIYVWLGTGTPGQFTYISAVNSLSSGAGDHNAVADLDGDGYLDYVAGPNGDVVVYGTATSPYFGTSQQNLNSNTEWYAAAVRVVDLDADGRPDMVKGGWGGNGALFLSMNQGSRSFSNQTINLTGYSLPYVWDIQTPDLNGDGLPELIATDANTNRVFVYRSRLGTVSTFMLVPNRTPAAGDSLTVAEDSGATAVDVLANDTDPDGSR